MMRIVFATLAATVLTLTPGASAMTVEEREKIDFSKYKVTNPDAGYFDFRERKRFVEANRANPILNANLKELQFGKSCREIRAIPKPDALVSLPGYYKDNANWRRTTTVFASFEDAISRLAATEFVIGDKEHADCVVDVLLEWAEAGSLLKFDDGQGWYQIESTLFAIALGYATVRPLVTTRDHDLEQINKWLSEVAVAHLPPRKNTREDCCNNHFYRRALYATIIGILTGQDDLFRFGARAIHSALSEADAMGALPREMIRGSAAAHYQNFAVMYLIFIAELMERQGYAAYDIDVEGRDLHLLVDFALSVIRDPSLVAPYTDGEPQNLRTFSDPQYYAWMEPYYARFGDPRADALVAPFRPVYNRSLGGFATLYFYDLQSEPTPEPEPGFAERLFDIFSGN